MTSITFTLILHAGTLTTAQVPAEKPQPDMVLFWNAIALQAIRDERTPPPMAARNLAIVHVAVYDAVMCIARTHKPYAVELTAAPGTSAEAAAAAAAYYSLAALYPKQKRAFDRALLDCLDRVPAGAGLNAGLELGRSVADKIVALRSDDKSARAKAKYAPKLGPGVWEPTPPGRREALYPEWGNVTCFCIKPGTQYKPEGPPALNSPRYTAAFNEVKTLGGMKSDKRTDEQTQIALFWADNAGTATPPGHWNEIAQSVARQRGTTLVENARLFALLNMSLCDAGVLCWVLKFTYGFWRPSTAIHRAGDDGNPDTQPDTDWEPLLETPPFPTYTSGHSTFSAAGASALANFFGTDKIRFTTTSDGLPGVKRSFDGFWAAAEEAGMSRIYGGIHYSFDNTDGLMTGRVLGTYVFRNYLQPRVGNTGPATRPPIVEESRR
jgi:membrane-associated phospholipid phosphatase